MGWVEVERTVVLIQLMEAVTVNISSHLTSQHWDFILCSLGSWLQTLLESNVSLASDLTTVTFLSAVCNLVTAVAEVMAAIPLAPQDNTYPPNITTEWEEFFSEAIFSVLFPIFVSMSGKKNFL